MRASVVTLQNPFDPLGSRRAVVLSRPRRVRALAPCGRAPVIALLNGRPLLRAAWRRRLRDGEVLTFVVLPRGGGGGAGGSNPLRIVLSLAVLAFAGWAAPALLAGSAGTVLFGSFTLGQLTTLGLTLAGQALINAVLPQPRQQAQLAASPTYSLAAQGNTARIEQPIPVQYGRMLCWPDMAAQPYTEFAGNEQYLYQLLCLGAGHYDIEQIRIEDTPIEAFDEIEVQVVPPGGQVTLFPAAVVTAVEVAGQELAGAKIATYARSGTTITVTENGHGRAVGQAVWLGFASALDGAFAIAAVLDANRFTVTTADSGSGSGSVTVCSMLGGLTGFVASGPDTTAWRLAVDLLLPRGLYATDDDGNLESLSLTLQFQAQLVDDAGAPLAGWIVLGTVEVGDRTVTPVRRSLHWDLVTPGRYRVRAFRLDQKSTDSQDGHEVLLSGLRAYLYGPLTFGGVTLIALRMRATNNLSAQASRRVAVIATRKLPVWTGSGWSAPVATRSIAHALADAASNSVYGAGLADTEIDHAGLAALDAIWTARGDRFDGRFDTAAGWWEAAGRIAAAGRAQVFLQGGKLRVVRDGPADLPVALFSMRNIVQGSFGIDYLMASEQTADAIEMSYWDAGTWSQRRVTARLPGSSGAAPAKAELFGVTDRAQAYREAMYQAAANRYRRRVLRFETEMEGFIPSLGDLIAVQHDVPGWGTAAEAMGWDAAGRVLHLSQPVEFGTGAHYVGLRRRDGSLSGPWAVSPGPDRWSVVLAATPDVVPSEGPGERTHVVFGPGQTWATLAKVTEVRPTGLYSVRIEAVAEDPSVHTADSGVTAPPIVTSSLPRRVTRPSVTGLIARRMPGDATRALVAWAPAADADVYQIEMAEGTDPLAAAVTWTRIAETTATARAVTLLHAARTMVRVRAIGLADGPWLAATLGSLIPLAWNDDPGTSAWTTDSNPAWSS